MRDTPSQTALRAVLNSSEAQLFVASVPNSLDLYTSKLGFTVAFAYRDPPF